MSSIYRAYDIRGEYGVDLTEVEAERIGRAYGTYVGGGEIVVGRDCRLSSPNLSKALIRGLISSGCSVVDIGEVPTPVLYFSIHHLKTDGGVMITGSHNAPKYNGFKLNKGTSTLFGEQIQEIKKIVEAGRYREGKGSLKAVDVVPEYMREVKRRVHIKKKLKVVVDGGNGVGGEIAAKLFEDLGCEVVRLYCNPDGNFPNHFPDPTVDKNLADLIEIVKKEKADLGVSFDGDADRLGVVDDLGRIVRGDQLLIFFSRGILAERRGAHIIFEVKCSQAVVEEISKAGGVPVMYRTGHSFIKKKMREENSPLAGEMSGHFFFADRYYGFDDGIYAGLRMAEIVSDGGVKLSEMVSALPRYFSTPEIRLHVSERDKFRIVDEVIKAFRGRNYEVVTVDGARIQFGDGWGLVRASNTEPALILRFEAKTEDRLAEIKGIVCDELRRYPELSGCLY